MKTLIKSILIISFFLWSGCGFKVVDSYNNFTIQTINTDGKNNRINYKIRNHLLVNAEENSENVFSIDIETKIIKTIKEKNIKNEITKYNVNLNTNVNTYLLERNKKNSFSLSTSGDYIVDSSNYSTTIRNEKNLLDNLTEELAKKIIKKITRTINDL